MAWLLMAVTDRVNYGNRAYAELPENNVAQTRITGAEWLFPLEKKA